MAPEYGATCGFFPVDAVTLEFLRQSGRDPGHVKDVESYYKAQGLFRDANTPDPEFTDVLELDLSTVEPALAGPKRPQDRVNLSAMKDHWRTSLTAPNGHQGHGVPADELGRSVPVEGTDFELKHGHVVIAAITSCTNTSNPAVMLAAGLLARNARRLGLTAKPWVKPSLAPGSRVVAEYYKAAGLDDDLAATGFNIVGYGCTTCIGNSGPLPENVEAAIKSGKLVATSVLSGNRNFEGRVHNNVRANYLASPPLVVAYALAGTVDIDFEKDPIGKSLHGNDVFLRDIWPSDGEIAQTIADSITPEMFQSKYGDVMNEPRWDGIEVVDAPLFPWRDDSTYVRLPPYFEGMSLDVSPIQPIKGARTLLKLADSITTDHISPAGDFGTDGPAGQYLTARGVAKKDFNSFGSRRGNHEVMMRGTFANVRIRNQVAPGTEGGYSKHFPSDSVGFVYDVSMKYKAEGTPLVVLAGHMYGSGSSRDWAAKGTMLLGVRAVIAKSFERIHRSNLVGMGVLPLCFLDGQGADELGLDGSETFDIPIHDAVEPGSTMTITATKVDGSVVKFDVLVRLDTPVDVEYYRNGGILHTVLRKMAKA
jgi:aconitate hydratase